MAKKINVTGNPARRIQVTGKPQRRIEHQVVAGALGADQIGEPHAVGVDDISLSALGSELIKRLRSRGGRPSLVDATEICRVPLSSEDLGSLERITNEIERITGKKPSVGQVVGIIVREYLTGRPIPRTMGRGPKNAPSANHGWLPRLAEIVNKASTVQQSAGAIEAAVKQLKKDIEAED